MAAHIRDEIVCYVERLVKQSAFTRRELIGLIDIAPSRYYEWVKRLGIGNRHNGKIPKQHWLFPQERGSDHRLLPPEAGRRLPEINLHDVR